VTVTLGSRAWQRLLMQVKGGVAVCCGGKWLWRRAGGRARQRLRERVASGVGVCCGGKSLLQRQCERKGAAMGSGAATELQAAGAKSWQRMARALGDVAAAAHQSTQPSLPHLPTRRRCRPHSDAHDHTIAPPPPYALNPLLQCAAPAFSSRMCRLA
jgi:hypothetical protein